MDQEKFHGLTLLAHCGGGAYGDVYYCEDPSGKRMALKIVSKKKIGDHWERELKGVKNYRKITEENNPLLKIFHVGEDDDSFYYTMEAADSACPDRYVPDTLALRLQKGALSQEQIPAVVQGVFEGIKAIHDAGFTHRDIKPDNILFVNGIPKLADIGLLSSLSAAMTQLAGTLDFIPPEERSADSPESSNRNSRKQNDLYAFGKVIYCAITGNEPGDFPSIPQNLSLTLLLKYYKQLAFQLCDKEPLRRMHSIAALEKELADIDRKITYGSTPQDHWIYFCRKIKNFFLSLVISAYRMTGLYWYIIIPLMLATGTGAYFLFRPEPPFSLQNVPTVTYTNSELKFSIKIPRTWNFFGIEAITIMIAGLEKMYKNPQAEKVIAPVSAKTILDALKKCGRGVLIRNIGDDYINQITVMSIPSSDEQVKNMLRNPVINMASSYGNTTSDSTSVSEIKTIKVAGYTCIVSESKLLQKVRVISYLIPRKDKSLGFILATTPKDYIKFKQEFEAVLSTLKFFK